MDISKIKYPVIIEGCKPLVDLYQNVYKDDKFLIRCLEDIDGGLVIIIYLQEKYNIYQEFKEIFIDNYLYKFNTDQKVIDEFSKYHYGYEIRYEKYNKISIEFGIYNINTNQMVVFIKSFPYRYIGKKIIKDFNLDFAIDC